MDRQTLLKCIELTDVKLQHYYNIAKRVGNVDTIKEQEYVRASIALKELKDELWEMYQRS